MFSCNASEIDNNWLPLSRPVYRQVWRGCPLELMIFITLCIMEFSPCGGYRKSTTDELLQLCCVWGKGKTQLGGGGVNVLPLYQSALHST